MDDKDKVLHFKSTINALILMVNIGRHIPEFYVIHLDNGTMLIVVNYHLSHVKHFYSYYFSDIVKQTHFEKFFVPF